MQRPCSTARWREFLTKGKTVIAKYLTILLVAVSALNAGCAISPQAADAPVRPEEIKIYHQAQIPQQKYTTVKYLWVQSWRALFWTPTWSSAEEGRAALQEEASRLGANALLDVACTVDEGGLFTMLPLLKNKKYYICSGTAIRMR